jgi:signal transduction histidine kinase
VRNLVDNAVKFAAEGGRIEVAARASADGAKDSVEVVVKDDGPGIPPEDRARVFERFYRVEKSRNRGAGGTGLGLAIVKHIMQQAGGTVSLESDVGKGSAFTLSWRPWAEEPGDVPPTVAV